ncbi:unnamed protein product [Ixodes pacificus]
MGIPTVSALSACLKWCGTLLWRRPLWVVVIASCYCDIT